MRAERRSHHFDAMGTTCSLFADEADLVEGERWVLRMSGRLTRFSAESELSHLNARAGAWCEVSAETESVLRASLCAYEMSFGLVNAAALPSMAAIGYTRSLAEGLSVATLERAQPLPSLPEVLELRQGAARVARGSGIDLGGIAKGWMADRLSEILGTHCLVNLGGDMMARGAWPVAFGDQTLMLRDHGAATSSVRKRRWGQLHHLIDPRTGLPAQTGLAEVSVVASSGFEAEIVAKTALLLGPSLAPAYCATSAVAWRLSA